VQMTLASNDGSTSLAQLSRDEIHDAKVSTSSSISSQWRVWRDQFCCLP
jgi:hypothetical protein